MGKRIKSRLAIDRIENESIVKPVRYRKTNWIFMSRMRIEFTYGQVALNALTDYCGFSETYSMTEIKKVLKGIARIKKV